MATDRRFGVTGDYAIKMPVKALAAANITLYGAQTIDGVAVTTGDRVLVTGQTSAVDNGIYDVDTGTWTRSADFDGPYDVTKGTLVTVNEGTIYSRTCWALSTADPITIGTSALSFVSAVFSDSATVSFTASGAGAVATTVQEKLQEFPSVQDFGAVGDGVINDDAAFAAAAARNIPVFVPPNLTYYLTSAVSGDFFSFGYPALLGGGSLPNLNILRRQQPADLVPVVASGAYWAFGDSFTTGQGATTTAQAYAYRLAQKLGMPLTNYGVSGKASFEATKQLFNRPATAVDAVNRTNGLATWMAAFNDVYRGGSGVKTLSKIKGELRSFLAAMFETTCVAGNSAGSVTGTWSSMGATSMWTRAERSLGGFGRKSTENGAALTYAFSGDNLVIHTYNSDGVNERVGSFTATVDGTLAATFNGDGKADGITDGSYNNRLTHEAVVLSGFGSGAHTAVITVISDGVKPVYIDAIGTMMPGPYCAPVVIGEGAFQPPLGWAQGGGIWSQAAMEAATRAVNDVVAEFSGYPVAVARTNDFFNPSNGIAADNNHPNDTGHAQIAAAFLKAMAIKPVKTSSLMCVLTKSVAQSLTTGVNNLLTFDTEIVNDGSMHSTSVNPSRITAPMSGYITLTGNLGWAANVTGVRQIVVFKNGAQYREIISILPTTGGNETVASFACTVPVTAGDYLELSQVQNSGGALNTYGGVIEAIYAR